MSDDESIDSVASSAPNAAGHNMSAATLSQHPLWVASSSQNRGRGGGRGGHGGRGRGRGPPSDFGDMPAARPRFERISLASLEQDVYENADGADSYIEHSDSEAPDDARKRKRSKRKASADASKRKASAAGPSGHGGPGGRGAGGAGDPDGPDDDDEFDDDDDTDGDDENRERRRRLSGLIGSAAFGGGGGGGGGRGGEADDDDETAPSEAESKRVKAAQRAAFPCKGISCVGCALGHRIGVVDKFVNEHVMSMTEDSLYKQAALRYKMDVADPIEREGGLPPAWPWKDLRSHYQLHVSNNGLARHRIVKQLQLLRSQLESRIVRCEGEEKEIDRQTADLMLKTIAAESRERVLIDGAAGMAGGGGAKGRGKKD
jgi:hypothetical protein